MVGVFSTKQRRSSILFKTLVSFGLAFVGGVIFDRYVSDAPIFNITFNPNVKVRVENAYLKER